MQSSYDEEHVFELIRAAYERGYKWGKENPNSRPYLNKAAYDYADKTLGRGLPPPPNNAKMAEGESE